MESKRLIYAWRISAMLSYIKNMIQSDEADKKDVVSVIDNYLRFTDETTDARLLICQCSDQITDCDFKNNSFI